MKNVEIMDTTLRDGEQKEGVSFTPEEKLLLAKHLLNNAQVDSIEISSANLSKGDHEAVKNIAEWAKENNILNKLEVLGFLDSNRSVDWIYNTGVKNINLLAKGSKNHLTNQLNKTPEEHVQDIKKESQYASGLGMGVNIYLEDWSNGMKHSKEYVFNLIKQIKDLPIQRIMLPDTLGILEPNETSSYIRELKQNFPNVNFDFHGHNDYELSVANSLEAVKNGVGRIHTTVNGMGERAGNTKLASIVASINDLSEMNTNINEVSLTHLSRLVERLSGIHISPHTPITGEHVFNQNCGVHADGDKKGKLYQSKLEPERFGQKRGYSLGKTAGLASIDQNLKELGKEYDLTKDQKKQVLKRVKELSDQKERITKEDLPFIISDVLDQPIKNKVELIDLQSSYKTGNSPQVHIKLNINGENHEADSSGDGQYDAFMKAVKEIYTKKGKRLPDLDDYRVGIPPGGDTSSLVETTITWSEGNRQYKTTAVETDQLEAAIKATLKMLNINGS